MKLRNKIIAVSLATFMMLPFAACSPNDDDPTKTKLYFGVYDAGTGTESAYEVGKRFAAKYADVSFEEGKTGVQVKIVPAKYGTGLEREIADLTVDVFIGTSANARFLAEEGLLMDISDVYTKPFAYDFVRKTTDPNGSTMTFKDFLRTDLQDYYQMDDGKWYGFPDETEYQGIVYDIDLFEEQNLYFAKNGGFVTSKTDERSAGPDGDYETTYDNGLPATFDDFFTLCDKIVDLEMTPILWGGNVQEYVSAMMTALAADVDGKTQTELNYSYSGTATTLIASFDDNGNPVLADPEPISTQNGYLLYKTEGRYYALKFLERLLSNTDYYSSEDATNGQFDHTMAQDEYLLSKYGEVRERTAMIIEGNWWQKEALGTFEEMEGEHAEDSVNERRFAMMPFPKATPEKVGEPFVLLERCVGDGFVNANVPEYKVDLVKAFVQFLFTEESCKKNLEINGKCRPVNLTLEDEEYNALTPWGKNSYDLSRNAVTATMYSKSEIMQVYSQRLWYSPYLWNSKYGERTYTYPTKAMIDDGVSALNYFNGMSTYWTAERWQDTFKGV